jgi:hypothetical protein
MPARGAASASTADLSRIAKDAEVRNAFLKQVMTSRSAFDEWIVRHPRRLAAVLGWCADGAQLAEEISAAIAPYARTFSSYLAVEAGRLHKSEGEPMAETIDEFIDPSWNVDLKNRFRLLVRDYTEATGATIRQAADVIKPGIAQRILADQAAAPRKEGDAKKTDPVGVLEDILKGAAIGAGAGAPGGPQGAATGAIVGAGVEAARNIPWDRIFKIIEDAIKAKKERDIYRGFAYAYQEISSKKKFVYDRLIDGLAPDDPRIGHLKLRLDSIQYQIAEALKKLDNGDKDGAKFNLERILDQLKELRQYISTNWK